ncbi:MAG: hypothetical protein IT292_06585 [Deltaproteobacteria bacterium]|nr:hypothetical protein [Deltaproteobacteria bacterium]
MGAIFYFLRLSIASTDLFRLKFNSEKVSKYETFTCAKSLSDLEYSKPLVIIAIFKAIGRHEMKDMKLNMLLALGVLFTTEAFAQDQDAAAPAEEEKPWSLTLQNDLYSDYVLWVNSFMKELLFRLL